MATPSEVELELTTEIPAGVSYERVFDALADLIHAGDVPGVDVFCSGNNDERRSFTAHVWIDDTYDPKWNEV